MAEKQSSERDGEQTQSCERDGEPVNKLSMASPNPPRFHFVLVHGSSHGAWCWYKIVDLLQKSGHTVTAVDLAGAGMHPANPDCVCTWEEYFQPLLHVFQSLDDTQKVILVGHSAGGISVGHAMEAFPERVAVAIFITGAMLVNGISLAEQHERWLKANPVLVDQFEFFYRDGSDKAPTSARFSNSILCSNFYQMSPSEDVTLAKMLIKRHPTFGGDAYTAKFSAERYGSVPRVYIRMEKDLAMPPEFQDSLIDENPPDKVYSIESDHSPFFSAPRELHQLLLDIAEQFNEIDQSQGLEI